MPPVSDLLLFSSAALFLLIIPGPAVLYIVARSTSQGTRAGLISTLGIHAGTLVHIIAAVAGLSAILLASSQAFTVVKLAGAAYLLYLGIAALRARDNASDDHDAPTHRSAKRLFIDGAVLNVLNPKTAVFFLAFVPQFVDPAAGSPTTQLLVFSGLFVALGLISDSMFAAIGGWAGSRFPRSREFDRRKNTVAGTTYLALGGTTALGARS